MLQIKISDDFNPKEKLPTANTRSNRDAKRVKYEGKMLMMLMRNVEILRSRGSF